MCFSAMVKREMKILGGSFGAAWVREDLELFQERSRENPKLFPEMKDRIFQGSYAPILHYDEEGSLVISPMRYGIYEPSFIKDPKIAKAFNARRDNLTAPYWSEAYTRHHGFVLLSAFYEWVVVSDLLKAGAVKISEVKEQFAREAEARKARAISMGKNHAPTPTEKKDARFRKIIIQFHPSDDTDLYVPVIYSAKKLADGKRDFGFAIVTDDPQHEILAAGHDRSPSFVKKEAILEWINVSGKSRSDFQKILDQKPEKFFEHKISAVA